MISEKTIFSIIIPAYNATKFIEDKIRWYTKKNAENPKNFINGKYYGPDYINYLKAQVKLFNKNNTILKNHIKWLSIFLIALPSNVFSPIKTLAFTVVK